MIERLKAWRAAAAAWCDAYLAPEWRWFWRLMSVQIHFAAAGYLAVYEIMPALDPSIAKLLPTPFQAPAIGIYAVLGIVARLIAQKKPNG
jgi:hypothetical protein